MLDGNRMSYEFCRYLEHPDPNRLDWIVRGNEYTPCTFNVYMETPLSIIYDRFAQYPFLERICCTPASILSYCTYRFWCDNIQAPLGHCHDDVWCSIEVDMFSNIDSGPAFGEVNQSKALAYANAVMQLVNEVYPFFETQLHNFMQANQLYRHGNMDLDISGVMAYVVNFTLAIPTEG